MSFLTPMTALGAAAITLPLFLALYFLKLRRRYLRMASTLLWQRAFEDLEVNAPFQRLRFTALLFVQLLIITALLLAMARPIMQGEQGPSQRLIVLIDRSASMNATDGRDGNTRLDDAKAQAIDMVERLRRSGSVSEVMVIAFAANAYVATSFAYDRSVLVQAINAIEPTDETADFQAALQLAASFAGDSEEAGAQTGDVVLFSDGSFAQREHSYRLRAGNFRFVQVGSVPDQPVNNVGIVSFSARRDYDDPARTLIFARLANTSKTDIETVLTLRVDDQPEDLRRLVIPAATQRGAATNAEDVDRDLVPGEATVTFSLELQHQAVVSLEHNHRDVLPQDDRAWLVMPPPTQPRIALVHAGTRPDAFTENLLADLQPRSLEPMTAEAFAELDVQRIDAGEVYDMIVFDRVSPARLPGVPSLTFGGVPRSISATAPRSEGGRRFLSWDRQHPVMRHVSLDSIVFAGFGGFDLPTGSTALASGPDGPVVALVRTRGARHVVVGFDLGRSNWPMHISIVVFLQNVLDYITQAGSGQIGLVHQPAQPISVRATSDARSLVILGAEENTVEVQPGAMRTLPLFRQVGMYQVRGAAAPMDQIAVSMLSDAETNLQPRSQIVVNAEMTVGDRDARAVPRELWPWLVAAAMCLLVIEWMVYLRKATV